MSFRRRPTARSALLAFAGATVVVLVGACAAASGTGVERQKPRANLDAGIAALKVRDYDRAIKQLEIAIVANPKNPDGYYRLGQSHRARGDMRRAMKYIRLALQIEPNHLAALRERGETELATGEVEKARETLEQLGAKCKPSCPEYELLKKSLEAAPKLNDG